MLDTLDEFGRLKVNFISLSENLDLNTPMGKAMFTIISALASLERDLISERKKQIWRVTDVMAFTGIGYSPLMRYTSQKRIPHRKRANKLYFIPQEIMNWLDEGD